METYEYLCCCNRSRRDACAGNQLSASDNHAIGLLSAASIRQTPPLVQRMAIAFVAFSHPVISLASRYRLDMLAQKTRYALRSLLYIAEDTAGVPVQLARIAETQRVPPKYLELIMLDLKKAGLVTSTRGPRGGYRLTRGPSEISFGEIVRAMEGPIALVSCASVNFYAPCGDCHDEATCAIRRAFSILRDQSSQLLEGISLAEAATWEKSEDLLGAK